MSTPELLIDDVIGESFFGGGVSAAFVNRFLKENAKAREILVRVNSPGGDVFEGVAIYSALKGADAKVIVDVEGIAASAASYIAMAGDEVRVHKGAMLMIHEASGFTMGRASDHEASAALLKKINDEMADLYAARTGQDREKVLEMMAEETWLSAAEAKDLGFADSIVPAKGKPSKTSKAAAQLVAKFKRAPEALHRLAAMAGADEGAPRSEESNHMSDTDTARLSLLARIEGVFNKTGDELHGLLLALRASHEALPGVQAENAKLVARVSELEAAQESQSLEALITKAKAEKRCTPAMEKSVRAAFADKSITLKGAEAWLTNSPVITALESRQDAPAAPIEAPNAGAEHVWNGKKWDELTPSQRAELKREQPDLYKAMRRPA